MKKFLCVFLSVLMLLGCLAMGAGAAVTEDKTVKFNSDGKLKIMMINDTQDVGENVNEKMINFLEAALDAEKPDLVIFDGDQLADVYPFANADDYKIAIDNIIAPLQERGIPFLVTLGNHDHDRASELSEAEMYKLYAAYDNCYATENGPDPFTYNLVVKSSDGTRDVFNIYMMDSNNKADEGGYSGITETQLKWYNEKSAELKAANGGEVLPSLLFQHVPVKEIYKLFKVCDSNTEGAIYARRDGNWYVLDETKIINGTLGEAPCSENFDHITGQYQAWVENGDIMGAFFAHDHVNSFVGVTEDGILMGYNGGAGFRAYGDGGNRSVRIFELDENDVTNYTTRLVTYNELIDPDATTSLVDIFSPTLLTTAMKIVYFFFGWLIKLF